VVSSLVLDGLSRERLLELKLALDDELAGLKTQLERAAARQHSDGYYADPAWFQQTREKARAVGREVSRIATRLGQLRSAEKAQNRARHQGAIADKHIAFLHAFFRAAKRELSEGEFEALVEISHDHIDTGTAFDCDTCAQAKTVAAE
jgi:hypothetical protein